MAFTPKLSKFYEKNPNKINLFFFIIILLLIDKFFVNLVLFSKSKEQVINESKYVKYFPWSLISSLMIVSLVIIMSIKDSVLITTPIILTMFIMTTFEFMFVQIINKSMRDSIYNKGHSTYKDTMKNLYDEDHYNVYQEQEYPLYKFAQNCTLLENPTLNFIQRLNHANFSFLYGLLLCLVAFHIFKISNYPRKIIIETILSTSISTLGILFLFIFYYVNISSKYPIEPTISIKGLTKQNILDNFTKNQNKQNTSHIHSMVRRKVPLDFCADVCHNSDNCSSFQYFPEQQDCTLNIGKKHTLTEQQSVDTYIKNP
tara:strand:- start:2599 stop:3543 length:945 start_codon:yes stop_codon:yes gene_type:complete